MWLLVDVITFAASVGLLAISYKEKNSLAVGGWLVVSLLSLANILDNFI